MALELDLTELADGKFDLDSMPSGGNPLNYVRDFEWNNLCAVVDSVRDAALDLDDMITTLSATVETSSDAIVGLQGLTGSHGDRLTDLETSSDTSSDAIAGLQTLAADHGGRITALEEAPGGGDSLWSEADALTATMADYANAQVAIDNVAFTRDVPGALWVSQNNQLPNNPKFGWGNPYIAGIDLEACGVWYRDDLTGEWRIVWSQERSGTAAAVLDGVRRAGLEVYLQNGDEKPLVRLDLSAQGWQFGGGGYALAGSVTRSGTTLTVVTRAEHKLGAGALLYKQTQGGAAQFGSDGEWLRVATTPNATTFTVVVADSGITVNTLPISFTNEAALDVVLGRGAYGVAEIRVANPSDTAVETIYQGSRLRHQWFIGGALKCYVDTDGFHYTPTYWSNGGGETQTGQDTFYVNGPTSTVTDTTTAGGNGSRRRIWNVFTDPCVVSPSGGNTINGTTSYVIAPGEGVDLDALGTNWRCAKLAP